ncbi:hypothetical protein MRB53_041190 [Persea americana]|nr:hypothetical protein MRB53_041190 [Persea americana]
MLSSDPPIRVATYAAVASFSAAALVYIFGPSIFPGSTSAPGDSTLSTPGTRSSAATGLSNPANDCFINSTLQALAGLDAFCAALRAYAVAFRSRSQKELAEHQDHSDKTSENVDRDVRRIVQLATTSSSAGDAPDSLTSLDHGPITLALSHLLSQLRGEHGRPAKKVLSAHEFVHALEVVFGATVSRRQQDAQEFLQIVLEMVWEEWRTLDRTSESQTSPAAPTKDDEQALYEQLRTDSVECQPSRSLDSKPLGDAAECELDTDASSVVRSLSLHSAQEAPGPASTGLCGTRFPLEGTLTSALTCQTCQYTPPSSTSTFLSLTLHVPQTSNTTLSACIDSLTKMEHIDDFLCDKCRLLHALSIAQHASKSSEDETGDREDTITAALSATPLMISETLERKLPPTSSAPRSRIAKSTTLSPPATTLCFHLSRSIFDVSSGHGSNSIKNQARVSFPETLVLGPLGGERTNWRLESTVCHRGGHDRGHYVTFRRKSSRQQETDSAASRKTRRRKEEDKWWRISDEQIREAKTAEVLGMKGDVYLLFYEIGLIDADYKSLAGPWSRKGRMRRERDAMPLARRKVSTCQRSTNHDHSDRYLLRFSSCRIHYSPCLAGTQPVIECRHGANGSKTVIS